MPEAAPERAVLATFDNATAAEQAAQDLMGWDKANDDIKLGAIGVLTRDGRGEVRAKNYSARSTSKGAKIGMGLGVLAAVVSGGLTLIPTVVGGAVAGGLTGTMVRKGLGMTDDELQLLSAQLGDGRAALLVMCPEDEVEATTNYLLAAGGRATTHAFDAVELERSAQAAHNSSSAIGMNIFASDLQIGDSGLMPPGPPA